MLPREAQGWLCGVSVAPVFFLHHHWLVLAHSPCHKLVHTGQLCCGAPEVVDVPPSISSQSRSGCRGNLTPDSEIKASLAD